MSLQSMSHIGRDLAGEGRWFSWQLRLRERRSVQHWTRIKALSRRFAEGWADEYDTLRPVAELKRELDEQVYRMLGQPVRWEGPAWAHVR